jgi:oligopeptide transport system permease protein
MEVFEKDDFEQIGKNLSAAQSIKRPSLSYIKDAIRRLKKSKPAILSLVILLVLIIMSLIGPIITKQLYGHDYRKQHLELQYQTPIVSNKRTIKLSSNNVFTYKKYNPNLRKTELQFSDISLKKQAGKIAFIIGDKAQEAFQGDKKEYKLEVQIASTDNLHAIIKKLNAEGQKLLSEDPDFRGIEFKRNGNSLKIETVGTSRFNSTYWFGTDQFGRDIFTRLWEGGRVSFLIAFIAVFLTLAIGIIYGGVSGYVGGKTDILMMRLVEVLMVVPDLLYIIMLRSIMEPGLLPIIIVLSVTSWMVTAQIVRGEVLRLKNSEYVIAAQILGASPRRIIFKHLIPNTMGPILVNMTMMIPRMIFAEAFLSFFGLGVPAPFASWGILISDGSRIFTQYPHLLIIPGIALSLTMLAFNILGDGLRDALDPKLRK